MYNRLVLSHIKGRATGQGGLAVLAGQLIDQLLKRSQLAALYQVELLDKVDKVLKGGVEMGLLTELNHLLEVLVVYVGIHPKQSFQNGFGN